MCGPSPYNPIVSASGALLRDVLVGVVRHQQCGDLATTEARTGTKEAKSFEASERFHRLLAFSQSFAPAIFKAELFRVFKGD
jgi:hypothetical protein